MRAAVAALAAVIVASCGVPVDAVRTAAPSPSATVAGGATARTTPSEATPAASARGPVTDIAQVFRPVSAGWRPKGTTAIVASANDDATLTLVAVPIAPPSAPTPIVTFPQSSWSIRGDGTAIAISVATSGGTRIATYDVVSGASKWLTDTAPSTYWPVWSKDGAFLLYAMTRPDLSGTVYRIDADGTNRKEVATLERFGGLIALTPDGRAAQWSRTQAGGSAELLDIATGSSRHIEDVARIVSWRSQQPRALLLVGGCCAGRPGGSLVAWDDVTLASRVVAERAPSGTIAWGSAAWDPAGERIAAVRFDSTSPYAGSLVILDAGGASQRAIGGTTGAGQVVWIDEGIVFTAGQAGDFATDLMVMRTNGSSPVSLFNDARIQQFTVVRP